MTPRPPRPRILVVSADRTTSSGHPLNIGDALLTGALADELTARGYLVRIADFGPPRTIDGARQVHLGGFGGLLREVRAASGVVIGGGTLVQDDAKSGPPWRGLPRLLLATVGAAKLMGKKVALFGVGSNPARRVIPKAMLGAALFGTRVWVRDELSAGLLMDQWRKKSSLAADTAMLSRKHGDQVDDGGPLVMAAYAAEIALLSPKYLDGLRTQFGAIDFISMHQGDKADADAIPENIRSYFRAVHKGISVEEAFRLVNGAGAVLSSRMHALYLGLLADKPLACLSQRPKVMSFRREFDIAFSDPSLSPSNAQSAIEPRRADAAAVAAAKQRVHAAMDQLVLYLGDPRIPTADGTESRPSSPGQNSTHPASSGQ